MPETFHAGPNLGRLSDVTVVHGDCIEAMAELAADSVDAIVTDPPYGLEFMGKEWDALPPGLPWAQECLRVLKPGGHLLAFGGTRTWHRLAVAVEDAGFEIRDSLFWHYGSGFPKSHNVSKALDGKRCICSVESGYGSSEGQQSLERRGDSDPVRTLRNGGEALAESSEATSADLLLSRLPSEGELSDAGGSAIRSNGHEARTEVRSGQPSLERRGYLRAPEGELHRTSLRTLPTGVSADGPSGRLHHGASSSDGAVDGSDADSAGVREPHQPESARQPQGEPGVVSNERGSQAWRGWPFCERCSQPVVPDGLGTALKPATEPVVVGRKPFKGNVAANVLQHGTGALNIDACRIGTEENTARPNGVSYSWRNSQPRESVGDGVGGGSPKGRWPANVVLDSEMAARLDEQSGITKSNVRVSEDKDEPGATFALGRTGVTPRGVADSGGASRFFKVAELDAPFKYCAKAPKKERPIITDETGKTHSHPTVKPLTLMRWLVRLVTPPGGVVLDPFAGSGATVEAALLEGFRVIGIERGGPEGTDGYHYLPMIQQRIVRCLTSS